ncbi:MFS transporter [Metasolibacillus sp.]|uniref:MFS transporter n=1 Tax=Metasolibacillus sp. TaxID=2703680 RepID=UPI0025DEF125|nr:MFS transporter [Metasolibacillus sp.]MCT6924945.1 MFS transporter [Metasolibacillus sp.]MCT6941180.1 MFS transporter [Metasolibacillus sp.]
MKNIARLKKEKYHLWAFPISKLISSFGALVYAFAMSLYILQQTGSATSFALSLICSVIPRALVAPFAGYMADNCSRKAIVLTGQITIIIAISGLLSVSLVVGLSPLAIYITTIITSIASQFLSIALSASITKLFNAENVQRAMSFNQIAISLSSIASPVIAGILYGYISMAVFLTVYIGTTTLAVALNATMDFHLFAAKTEEHLKESIWQSMRMGVIYLKSQPLILPMLWVVFVNNFLFGAFNIGYSYTLIEILQMQTQHFGLTEAAYAIGMLLMSIWLSAPKRAVKFPVLVAKRCMIGMGITMMGVTLPLFFEISYISVVIYYMVLMFAIGLLELLVNIPLQVMLQKAVDDEFKGRIFSLTETMSMALMPLGSVVYGYLYDVFPAQWIFIISSLLLISVIIILIKPSYIHKAHPELSNV